jgi:peptide deformylase
MKANLFKSCGRVLLPALVALLVGGAFFLWDSHRPFTLRESRIIRQSDSLMKVMTMPEDSAILRASAAEFSPAELASPLMPVLLEKMLFTVRHPSQEGVGIAAPQVGISRRAVLVQRFDKPGEPFEAYLNIRIDSLSGEPVIGPEGCLSVPGLRGMVPRAPRIVISYVRPAFSSGGDDGLGEDSGESAPRRVQECVEGFTAVIFQHECDHLDGILYTDRAVEVFPE